MDLSKDLALLKEHFYREETKKNILEEKKKSLDDSLEKIKKETDTLEKLTILFQKTSRYARNQGKTQIESLTTRSLKYIFKRDYDFQIEISEKRNTSSADFFVLEETDNGLVKTKPEISKGGGIVDIVSLALRMAFLENYRPKVEGPLILDEPAKHVSEEYIFDIGDFLLQFSQQMNRQIIMITHNNHLASLAKTSYKVSQEDGISHVEKIQA
ncbi:ATPase [Neofamilia massiliensis]|uniref:ATPase n=1 Tax=Neofamilia massiliensis TaxID=1673724 RepID=UPI0006BB9863|nr:ATPase [Neofamilia massiliensis]